MKTPKKSLLTLSAFLCGAVALTAIADDHDHEGHDHSAHDHSHEEKKTDAESSGFKVSKTLREEIGLATYVVEMRVLPGKDDEVTAVPRSSLFEQGGKAYVFAQSESDADSFERWEVTLGAGDEQFVEAKTGVFPGDTLVSENTVTLARIEDRTFARPEAADQSIATNAPADTKTTQARTQPRPEQLGVAKVEDPCPLNTECKFTRSEGSRGACDQELRVLQSYHQLPPPCEPLPHYQEYDHGHTTHSQGYRDHHDRYGYQGRQPAHFHHHGW